MNKYFIASVAVGALVVWGAISMAEGGNKRVATAKPSKSNTEEMQLRKLTLTLGQSAHSVKMNPALIDQINEEAFINLISAYMNQPFDFTYQQEGFSFNIPRTHTLSLWAREKKLSDIMVEIHPIFREGFSDAFKLVQQWENFFDGQGLEKKIRKTHVPIALLEEKFKTFPLVRCGFSTGVWIKGDTEFSVGVDRSDGGSYNIDTKQTIEKPIYKVSINIRSISLKNAER